MKTLKYIFEDIVSIQDDVDIKSVHIDSRTVTPGGLFFALLGARVDGHDFISVAIEHGASVVVCEREQHEVEGVVFVYVDSVRSIAGTVVSRFFDDPSQKLTMIGVTGTNGKTSIATMAYQALSSLGFRTGLLSTVVNKIDTVEFESTHTTGDVIQVHSNLQAMVEAGCTHCCMEVSSHALDQGRVVGVLFDVVIFSNLTQDHLDYHESMEEYARTKKILFDTVSSSACAVVNIDDSYGAYMVADCPAHIVRYGIENSCDFPCTIEENSLNGLTLGYSKFKHLNFPLIGVFNAYNISAVLASLDSLNLVTTLNIENIARSMTGAPGRMQIVWNTKVFGIVDYAHTPDALQKILQTLHETKESTSRIITVFGAGGDRDATKRPLMAREVAMYTSYIIVTEDNPRTEDPENIFQDIIAGFPPSLEYEAIHDRREAIRRAVEVSRPGDIIVVAGKGHEEYQIIGTEKIPLSDTKELRLACEEKFTVESEK